MSLVIANNTFGANIHLAGVTEIFVLLLRMLQTKLVELLLLLIIFVHSDLISTKTCDCRPSTVLIDCGDLLATVDSGNNSTKVVIFFFVVNVVQNCEISDQ